MINTYPCQPVEGEGSFPGNKMALRSSRGAIVFHGLTLYAADFFLTGVIGVQCGADPPVADLGQKGTVLSQIKASHKPLKYLAP